MFIVWEHGSWALEAFEDRDGLDVCVGGVVRSCAVVAWGFMGGWGVFILAAREEVISTKGRKVKLLEPK